MMLLLRQFFIPFGWPWLTLFALALLPVVIVVGFLSPATAFAISVSIYVMLLGLPFTMTPKVLRSLICNRRLALVPGFAHRAMLASLLFTLLQSAFIPVIAILYGHGEAGDYLRNGLQLFIASSIYVAFMQYAVTTNWAVAAVSLFPMISVGMVLFFIGGNGRHLLGDDHLAWLLAATLLGWLLAYWRVGKGHQFKPEHESLKQLNRHDYQRQHVAQWLLGSNYIPAAPSATLLIGYPANLAIRSRILLYAAFLGPLMATVLLSIVGFGNAWAFKPNPLDLVIVTGLFPMTFGAFQYGEWVPRLRLLWLRRPLLRSGLWPLLEKQMAINTGILVLASCALTVAGIFYSHVPANVLLHYPLLVLSYSALFGYYIVCARCASWSPLGWVLLSFGGSSLISVALWVAVYYHNNALLLPAELLAALAALGLRLQARRRLLTIDWLRVKPLNTSHSAGVRVAV